MAYHDFRCDRCGQVLTDIHVPVAIGARVGAPEHCGTKMTWIAAAPVMDIGGVKSVSFKAFTTRDGQNRLVRVEAYHQMHRLEQVSEQQARNGEGQPIRFRMLHQDRSNVGVNTFGEVPFEKPSEAALRKFKPVPMGEEPGYGPGVGDHNTSALKDQ